MDMRISELLRGTEWLPQNMRATKRLSSCFFSGVGNTVAKAHGCGTYSFSERKVRLGAALAWPSVRVERPLSGRACSAARLLL